VFDELAAGVFRRRYESLDLNIGVVVADDGVLIIDTRASHVEADELREELGSLTPLPVRWVIDTHWHWDHTFGNARFPEAEIWGHVLCRKALAERGEAMKQAAAKWVPEQREEFEAVIITPPTRAFSETTRLDLGTMEVSMSYHGLGHTDSDIVISVEGADVTFMGDLVEEGATPVFDDGYPITWPETLRSALTAPSVLVPGHGDTMDRAAALGQLEELEAVAALALRCVEEGFPIDEASRHGPYPEEVMVLALARALEIRL
jgi:glyoxylase-like metal-dependent hydrolase (beta-lactamase superfamily II)